MRVASVREGACVDLAPDEAHHVRDVLRSRRELRCSFWTAPARRAGAAHRRSARTRQRPVPVPLGRPGAASRVRCRRPDQEGAGRGGQAADRAGLARLVPIRTERVVKGLGEHTDRWLRIAAEAAKQSGRPHWVTIEPERGLGGVPGGGPSGRLLPGLHAGRRVPGGLDPAPRAALRGPARPGGRIHPCGNARRSWRRVSSLRAWATGCCVPTRQRLRRRPSWRARPHSGGHAPAGAACLGTAESGIPGPGADTGSSRKRSAAERLVGPDRS